jgi:dTMP kinase
MLGQKEKGIYIVFEGGEGCGKSTQYKRLGERIMRDFPEKQVVMVREPGGTKVGEAVREILLNTPVKSGEMDGLTEVYLFAAARAQLIREVVSPSYEEGAIILSDRSVFSSLVYQGIVRGIGLEKVWEINQEAVNKLLPDMIILPDLSAEEGLQRVAERKNEQNRIDGEKLEFHQNIRKAYLSVAEKFSSIFRVIDGSLPIEDQEKVIWEKLCETNYFNETKREIRGFWGKER